MSCDLCDINDIELYLLQEFSGNPSDLISDVNRVSYLITAVSNEIKTTCNREFCATDYIELQDGNMTSQIYLNQFPIISVTSLKYGSPFGTVSRTEIESDDYIIYNDIGQLEIQFESIDIPQLFEIVYRAGYETIPDDLSLICIRYVVNELKNTEIDGNLKTEKLGDAAWSFFSSEEKKKQLKTDLAKWIKFD